MTLDHAARVRILAGEPATNGADPHEGTYPAFQPLWDAVSLPPSWLATDFLLAEEYTLLVGDGGSFKTTVMLAIAAAVAGGYPVLDGFPTTVPRPVLLISGEDSNGVLQNRLRAIVAGHGWDPDPIRANLHSLALEGVQLGDVGWQRYLRQQCESYGAALLCCDPLADLLQDDENDNSKARPIVQWFRTLNALGTAVLLCHHYGKASEHKQGVARTRGASAWTNAARAIYTVEGKDGGHWLGCGKMSRVERPQARELSIQITNDVGDRRAIWTEATVALAHPPGDWKVADRRELTPGERTGLVALSHFPDEALSWSRWMGVSDLSQSTLGRVIPRLKELGFIVGIPTGKRAGRVILSYQITPEGRNSLLDTHTPTQHPLNTHGRATGPTPAHPHPLVQGVCAVVPVLPIAEEIAGFDTHGDHGPGLEQNVASRIHPDGDDEPPPEPQEAA